MVNYRPSDVLNLFANLTYTMAEAGFGALVLDPISSEAETALTHSDFDFSEVGDLSNIDVDIFEIAAGGSYMFSRNIGMNLQVKYYMYDDKDPVIYDKDGDMFLIYGGLNLVL